MTQHKTATNKLFKYQPFNPVFWLKNPHVQTILPRFLAKSAPPYRRVLCRDSFDTSNVAYDFYDAKDNSLSSLDTTDHTTATIATPIVVLFHGLEGSSDSHYARTIAHQVHSFGWHYVVPHYRSCGGMPFNGDIIYNAGDTAEIHHVLSKLSETYENIHAIGVSLGGNMLAKYMGEYADNVVCQSAVIASAPVDLSSSSTAMTMFMGRNIYTPYLLNPLIKKALSTEITTEEYKAIKTCKNIYDFDHVFTAPRHNFCSVNDYYHKASALPYLKKISKPTLIITAKDDPFLGVTATEQDTSEFVTLIQNDCGGHIGFVRYLSKTEALTCGKKNSRFNLTWLPDTALCFFQVMKQV